jgi:hypothetical protein
MSKALVIDYSYLRYLLWLVRNANDCRELRDDERYMVGYLAACCRLKAMRNAERDKLFTLLKNAEKYRIKELNAFERRMRPPCAPRPWAMEAMS